MNANPISSLLAIGLVCILQTSSASAQDASDTAAGLESVHSSGDWVRVAASDRYQASRVHRFALGGGYRDLWQAEIELPVLDVASEAGGLTPSGRFGGLQTAVLGFKTADGRAYSFRGTDKDPGAVLPDVLKDTVIKTIVQDQMAAQHPAGPIAAQILSEAAGLHTIKKRMAVMPDDPALGEYREEFAGMVGIFFEFPLPASDANAGWHGASEIIGYEDLYARLSGKEDDQVDVEQFLRARLFDILIGDFDRHRKQWRWARFPGDPRWQPIPEDRDMAFVRYDGAGPTLGSIYVPILQDYGPKYPSMKGLTLHGWPQDRWLLPQLSWATWEAIALDLKARITDQVIDDAIAALPKEYSELDGVRLRQDLRGRRDRLVEGARAFFEHLAGQVDIQGSDATERVKVIQEKSGHLSVEVQRVDTAGAVEATGSATTTVFSRRFDPCSTSDIRLYLRGGDDQVVVKGASGPIALRVIPGEGRKRLDDSQGGGTIVYDPDGVFEVVRGPGTFVNPKPYTPPEGDSGFVGIDDDEFPTRDWGSKTIPIPLFGYEKDVGLFLGAGVIHTRYDFRKSPWSSRHRLTLGGATEAEQPRARYRGDFRFENSRMSAHVDLKASGIEVLNFYDFGNNTRNDGKNKEFRVRAQQYRGSPSVRVNWLEEKIRLSLGPYVQWTRTRDNRLIADVDPYGNEKFGMVGFSANIQLDSRKTPDPLEGDVVLPIHAHPADGYPTSGFLVDVTAQVSPAIWDVTKTWGSIDGSVAGYLSMGKDDWVTWALRVGGRETFGRTPYFAKAYIGGGLSFSGGSTVRGLRMQRFGGDSSLYGNLDLRVVLGRVKVVVPGDFGLIAFGDVGRVFVDGQSSDKWHPGYGGGLWFAPMARANALSLTVANSEEDTLFYVRMGFAY